MVSTPELAIAKAALTASLSRADPTSLTRGAVNEILQFIDNTLDECSRPNVQKCKNWILSNVVHSTGRSATFGKYLVALSESMELDYDRPSVRRRRLHALYLVNDVLHHVVVRQGNRDFARAWDAQLPALVATASTFEKCPRHLSKVRDLITLWEQKGYLSADLIKKLRDSFTRASDKYSGTQIHMTPEALQLAKEAPYIMPSHHGDPSMSWNNLPAATWLAEMVPNSTIPMRKSMCRPVQLQAGVAKEGIIQAVKATLADADNIFHKKPFLEKVNYDFNLLGEVQRPSNSDDTVCPAETYWGWSREFCRSMKGRATRDSSAPQPPQSRRSRSVSQGVSRTSYRSRSRPSSKRPRYSSPSRSRSRSRSPRRSRSHTPGDYRSRYAHRDRRSRSPYSRSRSPAARRSRSGQRRSYSRSPSRSRSRSSSPSRSRQGHHQRYPHHGHRNGDGHPAPPPPAAPPAFHAMPAAPGQFPIPPPPPPPMGYQGVFPPPPPPPQGWTPNQPGFAPHMMGGWGQGHVPPPPPQPPMPYDGQQQHNGQWGRGSGRGGGGRGYRGRGRGGNGRGGYGYGY